MNRLAVALIAVAGMSSSALAGVEVGGTAGVHLFSDTNALGTEKNGEVNQANSALFGLRLGVYFGQMIGVELEGGLIPTETTGGNQTFDIYNAVARGHLIAQFRSGNADNTIIPFFLLGGGAMRIIKLSVPDESATGIRKDTDGLGYVGVGAKYRAGGGWGVRLDLRVLFPPDNTGSFVTQDFEGLASLYKEFGRAAAKKTEPVKTDDDPDKDGITGDTDKCPTEAEDKDEFQDEDGCPDADNDADGIADPADKCPLEAEDKDNFEDDNGCPDPDNDADGVPDAADKCADQPETKNGFEDQDGCPDEVPPALLKFTGTIQGINFKVNSADLLPASNKVLDKALGVLTEFEAVRLEIQGHTDDQALKTGGKFPDNDALSQARAETVKAYFVKKGVADDRVVAKGYGSTAPITDPAGLKGAKLKAARAVNRRVEFKLISSADAEAPKAEEPKAEEKKEEKAEEKKEEKAEEKKEEKKEEPKKP